MFTLCGFLFTLHVLGLHCTYLYSYHLYHLYGAKFPSIVPYMFKKLHSPHNSTEKVCQFAAGVWRFFWATGCHYMTEIRDFKSSY